jgi:N-acyl-D-aspartate/D-glutamate deacylase
MDANIVVFDPATVADKATYENANQPAVGVQTVLVDRACAACRAT